MPLLLATLVGCNYAGTGNDLHGCINDVVAMRNILISRYHFAPQDIKTLTDNVPAGPERATGANIKRALRQMVERARGVQGGRTMLFFHFSGHGTLLDGGPYVRREAIVPCDFNLITDLDFRRLVNQVPPNATFTMVSDSCHSGGLIAQEVVQIGPAEGDEAGGPTGRCRHLPYQTVLRCLGAPPDLPQLKQHMFTTFGDEASALFLPAPVPVPVPQPRPASGILLSGCQWDEWSADGHPYGAFTNALVTLLGAQNWPPITNWQMVTQAREMLQLWNHTQHPCLYCTVDNAGRPFLG